MNRKNNRYSFFAAAFVCAALLSGGCNDRDGLIDKDDARHVPALNAQTFMPLSNESGSVKAYVGTEVSVSGFNLDQVGSVTMDDITVEITEQNIKQIKFKIPALDHAQRDQPYAVELKAFDKQEQAFYTGDYFVTIPVTDAIVSGYAPAEGTVGTEITLSGRNLEQVTRVHFGGVAVEASAFTEVGPEAVKFLVPAGNYTEADSDIAISAEWGTATIDVTGETLFALHIPILDPLAAQPDGVNSVLGDEIDLTGKNLDLIDAVKWGEAALTIVEKADGTLKVRFPATIEQTDPVVQSAALTAEYGTPAQVVTLAAAWRLDTTPSATVLVPEASSMTAVDGGSDNKFYLDKTVTVAGMNLMAVEGIELRYNDGEDRKIAATLLEGTTDGELKFVVPEEVTFDTASEVDVVALYNGGDVADFGKATVYPFYFFPNIQMGIGSSSKTTYPDFNREHAFFLLNSGQVISGDAWWNDEVDTYAKSGTNSLISGGSKLAASATGEQYYGVQPYFFFSASSTHKLGLNSPANSASQLKTHCYMNGSSKTSLPSTFGTPILYFRVLAAGSEQPLKESVADGSVTTLVDYSTMGGSAAPALGKAETSSAWVQGSVIAVQYINHAHGLNGGKPDSMDDICQQGFLHIRQITCADLANGTANEDREGMIVFDFYWSKTLNK